jgi:N-methylhydantoinase A
MAGYRIGVDIGGTFTDFVLVDEQTGAMTFAKHLTTPADPSRCVVDGVQDLASAAGVPLGAVLGVVHGTTLATNAVIERRGALTGMITTRGFGDLLDMGRERRYDLYDLRLTFPPPIVPRALRREVGERVAYDGAVAEKLDPAEAERAAAELVEGAGVEALAVCLLHAYANPVHEEQARAVIAERFPRIAVSTSADVFPYMGEFERFTTATINAYVQPLVDHYLGRLQEGLRALGFGGTLHVMNSAGGTMGLATARRYPVRMLESGPVAGALMSAAIGRQVGHADLLSFDMGGTTAKGCIVLGGEPRKKYDLEVGRRHEFKPGSGLPVRGPFVDMIEIGAGGGSIAEVDDRGLIRVGPRSAGADPGPACYGRGSTHPTLTDANLLLGYLDPAFFNGGLMPLDPDAARAAVESGVADPLRLDAIQAAWGIHEIINEEVARAFRIHAAERGVDYRRCTMVAFGGSGPIHALRVARKLRIGRVIFPVGAGVMSAVGLLVSPLSFDAARSHRVLLDDLPRGDFEQIFARLVEEAAGRLAEGGVPRADMRVERRLDVRYRGQGFELEIAIPEALAGPAALARVPALFAQRYVELFAVAANDAPLEVVNWKVTVSGPRPPMADAYRLSGGRRDGPSHKGQRPAYFPGPGFVACAVLDRYALRPGEEIAGPVLVEERESTCVIGPGERARVDERLNLVVALDDPGASA